MTTPDDLASEPIRDDGRTVEPLIRRLLESLDLHFWIATPDLDRVVYSTPRYESLFGRPLGELHADPRSFFRSFEVGARDQVSRAMAHGMLSDSTFHVHRPGGDDRYLRVRLLPFRADDGTEYIGGVTEDVTEQRVSEDRVTEVMERLESVLNSTTDAVIGFDYDWRFIFVNDSAGKWMRRDPSTLLGKHLHTELPDGVGGAFNPALRRVMGTRIPETVEDHIAPWGGWFETRIFPISHGVAMMGQDISERKLAERRETQHLRLLEFANVVATTVDDNRITYWNREAERVYGYSAQEALGSVSSELLHTRYPLSHDKLMAEIRRTGTWDGQVQRRDRDGRDVFLVSHMVLYREGDTNESLIVEVNSDIGPLVEAEREQHRLVNELHRTERLNALGQLAGGIAHDFGNLLTVMIDNMTAIGGSLTEGSQAEADLAEARRVAERAEALTHQLMVFARNEEGLAVPVEFDALVFDLASMLGRLVGDHIDFLLELTSGRASVMADPSRLEQVVMNLVLNARDALPYGGHVRAVTTVTEVTEADPRGLEPGEYVRLTVSDDGVGMSSDDLERAFDPLFTTKISGKGTGFGLSTVLGVVSAYGGTAEIESEPNVGTSVSVWLPRVPAVTGGGGANA